MRSRTVRPIKRREQGRKNVKKQKKRNLGDTMPMRPVREDVYDTPYASDEYQKRV
ncbi:MAG: hypothetical protein ACLUFY_05540 [[Ruminococcus] torques]